MKDYKYNTTSFFVMGAPRCGNESIHHCLSYHPMLSIRDLAHSGHFANDFIFDSGQPDSEIYNSVNGTEHRHLKYGEVCSSYLTHSRAISRIYHYNSKSKLIISLRNPAERAFSQWQSNVIKGQETRDFKQAIVEELEDNHQHAWDQSTRSKGYLVQSKYAEYISHLRQYFDPHQLLFIKAEDLRDDTEVSMYQILQFLDLPYLDTDCSAQNVGKYNTSLSSHDRKFVQDLLRDDIGTTQAMLGWQCADWLGEENEQTVPSSGVLLT